MSETDKNELWKIIARAMCAKLSHDCARCALWTTCVTRAKKAADNIKCVYFITPKGDHSLFISADINDIPTAEVVEESGQ